MKHITLLLLSIFLFIACEPDSNQKEEQNLQSEITEFIFNSEWKLSEFNGETIAKNETAQSVPTVRFNETENRFYGSGGCNQYNGVFELDAGTGEVEFTQIAATKMACPDMSMEDQYFAMLDEVDRIELSSENMKFINGSGEILAQFEVTEN
jgi:heat shock protein HslJ